MRHFDISNAAEKINLYLCACHASSLSRDGITIFLPQNFIFIR